MSTKKIPVGSRLCTAGCTEVLIERMGMPCITEARYENDDGTAIDFTADYLGSRRTGDVIPDSQSIVFWKE